MFYDNVMPMDKALESGAILPLETFETPYNTDLEKNGVIRIVFPEFTCVCPKTGYPDFAVIKLFYLPGKKCVELKSWKLFLNSFRMVGAFHEAVTHHIFTTVNNVLDPKWSMVIGDFLPRGNVDTTVVFEQGADRPRSADILIGSNNPHCGMTV